LNLHKRFNITEQFNVTIIYKNCTCLSNSCIYRFTTLYKNTLYCFILYCGPLIMNFHIEVP